MCACASTDVNCTQAFLSSATSTFCQAVNYSFLFPLTHEVVRGQDVLPYFLLIPSAIFVELYTKREIASMIKNLVCNTLLIKLITYTNTLHCCLFDF